MSSERGAPNHLTENNQHCYNEEFPADDIEDERKSIPQKPRDRQQGRDIAGGLPCRIALPK